MLEQFIIKTNRVLTKIAGVFLLAMILLTCANIFSRFLWTPIRGTFELMGFFGALVAAFSLGYTQMTRGHIAVDILFRKFPKPLAKILTGINHLLCAAFFSAVSWQLAQKAAVLMKTGELSETLRIPYYPFTYGAAVGCGILTLVFIVDFLKILFPKKEYGA